MNQERHSLDVTAEQQSDATIVRLTGEVDLRSSPGLRDRFLQLLAAQPARIILDLAGVGYIDSSGVGTIVDLKRRATKANSQVVLVGLQPRVQSLFEITRLDKFFTIVQSIDEARKL